MKRNTLFFFGFFLLVTTCWNCTDNSASLTAVAHVKHYLSGRRAPLWDRIYIPSIEVNADFTGNPVPTIDYVQVANKRFSDAECFSTNSDAMTYFYSNERIWMDSVPESKLSPVAITIHSNNGSLTGSIPIPDTIKTLTIPASDTIPLNSKLTISWTGSNADYYLVEYYHTWSYMGLGYLGYSKDTIVKGNSLVFGSSLTSIDGDITDIAVTPVNGPFPVSGAKPNLSGDGYGYLFAENISKQSNRTIAFGNGINYSMFQMPKKRLTSAFLSTTYCRNKLSERYRSVLRD